MVDIVNSTNTFAKVEEVRNRSDNIIDSDVLWNEVVSLKSDVLLKHFLILRIFKNFFESLERYLFVDAKLSAVKINISVDVYHAVAYDLNFALFKLCNSLACCGSKMFLYLNVNVSLHNTCGLDLHSLIKADKIASLSHYLACHRIYNRS